MLERHEETDTLVARKKTASKASSEKSISIVIPTYNRAPILEQVLGSYLSQERVREVVIVDDSSTDGTRELIQSLQPVYPRLCYVRNRCHQGLPAARNIGVAYSTGKYVLFGEDDLRFGSTYAETLLECLEELQCSIVAGRILFPVKGETDAEVLKRTDAAPKHRLNRYRLIFDASSSAENIFEVPFIHACSLIKRTVFDEIQFDEGFRGNAYREETDFYLSARRRGHKIFFCPHALCFHLPRDARNRGGTRSGSIWTYKYWSLRNNGRLLRKHYSYLRQENIVGHHMAMVMVLFAVVETRGIVTHYMRRYAPRLYSKLAKQFA